MLGRRPTSCMMCTLTETKTMRVMMMPSINAFSQLPMQKCSTLVKKPRLSTACMDTQAYLCQSKVTSIMAACLMQVSLPLGKHARDMANSLAHACSCTMLDNSARHVMHWHWPCAARGQSQDILHMLTCVQCAEQSDSMSKGQGHTGSMCLGVVALKALGEGKSSSENRLGARFLASSIIGSSSSCSSGSLSAKLMLVRLEVCFCMLSRCYCMAFMAFGTYDSRFVVSRILAWTTKTRGGF